MPSISIPRGDHPGKDDRHIAEAVNAHAGFRYFAIVRYKAEPGSPVHTHFGLCEIPQHLTGYLNSPHCHHPEIVFEGPILTEEERRQRVQRAASLQRKERQPRSLVERWLRFWRALPFVTLPGVNELQAAGNVRGLIRALGDEDAGVRRDAAKALGVLGDERAVPPLIASFSDDKVRWVAAEALGLIGTPSLEPLITAMDSEDKRARWGAAGALGELRDDAAVPALVRALADGDDSLPRLAAEALGKINSESASDALVRALGDPSSGLRKVVSQVLRRTGAPRDLDGLLLGLDDNEPDVRMYVSGALGRIGDPRSVPHLIRALKDDGEGVRRAAAEALGEIGDPVATAPLNELLQDRTPFVRAAASDALGRLGTP